MKLLLDENLSHKLAARLADAFPGTVHVDGVGLRGQPDAAIWDYAGQHGFVLVSKDAVADLLLRHQTSIAAFAERAEDALFTLAPGVADAP